MLLWVLWIYFWQCSIVRKSSLWCTNFLIFVFVTRWICKIWSFHFSWWFLHRSWQERWFFYISYYLLFNLPLKLFAILIIWWSINNHSTTYRWLRVISFKLRISIWLEFLIIILINTVKNTYLRSLHTAIKLTLTISTIQLS